MLKIIFFHIKSKIIESQTPLDETKLQFIIKMHIDFYINIQTMIDIFHPTV
jgi:hypothetical protein